jgi:catechol 2,3-dioxygenase-like lactoylglutathione lyase family enzyme
VTAARVDHLVVLAATLAEGERWSVGTLGATPGPGGEHPLMGTHNRLMRVATVDYPRAYLEIIAVNPGADPALRRPGARWFDMDDAAVMQAVAAHGPRLAHFVAVVPDLDAALAAWRRLGIDRGDAVQASRMTPRGLLQWRIAIRGDGQRLFDGCLPTLIEWGDTHPAGAMADTGLALQAVSVTHPRAAELARAFAAVDLQGVTVAEGQANLCASLLAPAGRVRLESKGL